MKGQFIQKSCNKSQKKMEIYFYFVCMSVFPICVCVYHLHAGFTQMPEEDTGFLNTGVSDSCEPLCCCRKLNLGLLEE